MREIVTLNLAEGLVMHPVLGHASVPADFLTAWTTCVRIRRELDMVCAGFGIAQIRDPALLAKWRYLREMAEPLFKDRLNRAHPAIVYLGEVLEGYRNDSLAIVVPARSTISNIMWPALPMMVQCVRAKGGKVRTFVSSAADDPSHSAAILAHGDHSRGAFTDGEALLPVLAKPRPIVVVPNLAEAWSRWLDGRDPSRKGETIFPE